MKYRYIGEGLGVPGLPHEITDEEAAALGVTELLAEAVRNGNYREAAVAPSKNKKSVDIGNAVESKTAR